MCSVFDEGLLLSCLFILNHTQCLGTAVYSDVIVPNSSGISKTYLFKYTEKLITEKLKIFKQKIQIFFIFLLKT